MNRESLEKILTGTDEVCRLARSALVAGASYRIWEGVSDIESTRTIYGRRYRTTRRVGQPSVGFSEAVEALRAYEGTEVAIGYVGDRPRGGFYFQIFLTPDLARVVACLGVERYAYRPRTASDNES